MPHCHWEVFIDPEAEPIREASITKRVGVSRLASLEFPPATGDDTGGWEDYRRPFDPDFRLECLSRAALVRVCREFLVQDHLLVRALMLSVADRAGDGVARQIASAQWVGAGAVAATRLRRALGIAGDGMEAIAAVLRVHPAFVPGYATLGVAPTSDTRGRLWLEDGDAFHEGDAYGWHPLLADAPHPALDAMVQAVNPGARCVPAAPAGRERLAWDIVVEARAEAAPPPEVAMVAGTTTAAFVFHATDPSS